MLGDFSITALDAKHQDRLSISLAGYKHIHESTHLGGRSKSHLQSKSPYSVQIQETMDQKKLRIWTIFT